MLCFYATQATHHPSVATFVAGLSLATAGSPLAGPVLAAKPRVEHLPSVTTGLILEGTRDKPYVTVGTSPSHTLVHVIPLVFASGSVHDPAPGKLHPRLLRAEVLHFGNKLVLAPESTDDDGQALLVLKAGYGGARKLGYHVDGGEKLLESEGAWDPWVIAALEIGGTLTARRRTPSLRRFIGGPENKIHEEIKFTFDGTSIQTSIVTNGQPVSRQ